MLPRVEIVVATTQREYETFTSLVQEYLASLPFSTSFQDTQRELLEINERYGELRGGAALMAKTADDIVGIVALRDLGDKHCELKRRYVRPHWRGCGVGRLLCEAAFRTANQRGYVAVRLDTVPGMHVAIGLYRSLGFVEIPAYRNNPITGALFFERTLPAYSSPND